MEFLAVGSLGTCHRPMSDGRRGHAMMKYDQLGFPIPTEFGLPTDDGNDQGPGRPGGRRRTAGPGKRLFLLAVFLTLLVPAVIVPVMMPAIREAVVQWSLERAIMREGRGSLDAAIGDLSRAIRWAGGNDAAPPALSRLLCWRAMLRIENRDAGGGLADADQAASVAPTIVQPHRIRALAHVVLGDADSALTAAQAAVDIAGQNDPETLNHRAYIRALVGRDLEAALEDIDQALADNGAPSPELLDTRGYVLHLLGRQQEAVDDLNIAIDSAQNERRRLLLLAGHVDPGELAYRLRSANHGLAVMHHHRGLACRALGLVGQAEQDLAVAEKKGFDPTRGIF
jgi:tetratricopeptide (TPR) repeat protein